jgi:hypothetical protein
MELCRRYITLFSSFYSDVLLSVLKTFLSEDLMVGDMILYECDKRDLSFSAIYALNFVSDCVIETVLSVP